MTDSAALRTIPASSYQVWRWLNHCSLHRDDAKQATIAAPHPGESGAKHFPTWQYPASFSGRTTRLEVLLLGSAQGTSATAASFGTLRGTGACDPAVPSSLPECSCKAKKDTQPRDYHCTIPQNLLV
eukprot:720465-Amphidinium_carterae.1